MNCRKELAAEKEDEVMPLPQLNWLFETPQFPFDDFIVKLVILPERVYIARVCVDHVPADNKPPVKPPDDRCAVIVALEGRPPVLC